jgi:hypothetical protein
MQRAVRINPGGVSDHERRSSPPFTNHPTPPKPARRANRQVAQGAARLCGRALGTQTPISGQRTFNRSPHRASRPATQGSLENSQRPGLPAGSPQSGRGGCGPFVIAMQSGRNPPRESAPPEACPQSRAAHPSSTRGPPKRAGRAQTSATPRPKPAPRANRQVAQGAARLCGRALGTRAPIRAIGHAPINAIPSREAISGDRSIARKRRFASSSSEPRLHRRQQELLDAHAVRAHQQRRRPLLTSTASNSTARSTTKSTSRFPARQ